MTIRSCFLAALLWSTLAEAQAPSFPADETWITVTKGLEQCTTLLDPALDSAVGAGTGSRDIVSANEAAVQVFADASFVYFRLRVDTTPSPPGFDAFGWGCQLSTDGNDTTFEWMVYLDGKGDLEDTNAVVRVAPAPPIANTPADTAIPVAPAYAGATHARSVGDGSGDFFVDFAVPRERVGFLCETATATLVCGANSNAAARLTTGSSGDIAGVGQDVSPTWGQAASCLVTFPGRCEAGGQLCDQLNQCVDCVDQDDCPMGQFCAGGTCVGCVSNTDCDLAASPTCTAGGCGPCTAAPVELRDAACIDDDNGAQIEACHELTGQCVQCRIDAHCVDNGGNAVCDAASSTCGECNVDDDCAEPRPVCDTSAEVNVCVGDGLFEDGFESGLLQ